MVTYLQLDLRLGSPSIAQNSETGCNNWLTCGQRPLNDPEIDGGSTANQLGNDLLDSSQGFVKEDR
jgi:hypothetical protein